MKKILLKNAYLASNNLRFRVGDVLIEGGFIKKVAPFIIAPLDAEIIDCRKFTMMPGIIDSQVHNRDAGLSLKETLLTGSKAAVAGGVTSVVDQPNNKPPTISVKLWQERHQLALANSMVNYAINFGVTNTNIDEIRSLVKSDSIQYLSGLKIFAGSSTGDMLVSMETIESLIIEFPDIIKIFHSEEESIIRKNTQFYKDLVNKGDEIEHARLHSKIRPTEACFEKTDKIIFLARDKNSRVHIYHISTAQELGLFTNDISLKDKIVTAEGCFPHLVFTDQDYDELGNLIKCNPSIKTEQDRDAIRAGVRSGLIDVISTDHAPHEIGQKMRPYFDAPSGIPSVGQNLVTMLQFVEEGIFTLQDVVRLCCHNQADLFGIQKRGYIKEGFKADLVLVANEPWTLKKEDLHTKVGWSPLEGRTFDYKVKMTIVNGEIVYTNNNGVKKFNNEYRAELLTFDR